MLYFKEKLLPSPSERGWGRGKIGNRFCLFSCFFALSSDFGPAKKMNENVFLHKNVRQETEILLKINI